MDTCAFRNRSGTLTPPPHPIAKPPSLKFVELANAEPSLSSPTDDWVKNHEYPAKAWR
jgi:hypothetical protein